MNKNELLNLLNQMDQQEDSPANPHERVLLIDGLNLFFRNFAMMNFVNEQGVHIGGLGGFIRSLNSLINQINPSAKIVSDSIRLRPEKSEVFRLFGSNEKLKSFTHWKQNYSLEEGLAETVEWFSKRENLQQYKSDIYNV